MSNRNPDPDREPSSQLFVADAKPGSTEKALSPATSRGGRGRVEWSPNGKTIAFLEGDEKKWGVRLGTWRSSPATDRARQT
jgi:Tol biopolymer transport system component